MATLDKAGEALVAIDEWICSTEREDEFSDFVIDFWDSFPNLSGGRPLVEFLGSLPPQHQGHLHGVVLEDFLSFAEPDEPSVYESFLEETKTKVGKETDAFLRCFADSRMSVYEITEVVPKSHLVLKDLLRKGEPVRVEEKLASTWLVTWQKIAARILYPNGTPKLTGGTIPVSPDAWEFVKASLDEERKDLAKAYKVKKLSDEVFEDVVLTLVPELAAGLYILENASAQEMPRVVNFDGDEISLNELRFPIGIPLDQLTAKLRAAPDIFGDPGSPIWAYIPSGKKNGTVHAHLEIQGNELVAAVNSNNRAKEITSRLTKLVKRGLGKPSRTVTRLQDVESRSGNADIKAGLSLEDQAALDREMEAMLAEHYLTTLDAPVPMINGIPRELVKTKSGAKKVADWLKTLESMGEKTMGRTPYFDFLRLWKELGIEHLRK